MSYITLCFFLLELATCIVQSTLGGLLLSHGMKNRSLVTSIIDVAGVQRGFASAHDHVLEICYGIPGLRGTACEVVYNGSMIANQGVAFSYHVLEAAESAAVSPDNSTAVSSRGVSITPYINGTGAVQGVIVSNLTSSSSPTPLSIECVKSLTWLETLYDLISSIVSLDSLTDQLDVSLRNTKSEDVIYIVFQCWLFSVSLATVRILRATHPDS